MISTAYTTFFKELAKNNNKEWFHANKKTYDKAVRGAFVAIVEALIPQLQLLEPDISPLAKDALFRINRDIRFSKDKTPYNTIMKASFAPGGKRSTAPGFYLGISAEHLHVGGGIFKLDSPSLKRVRQAIAEQTDEFLSIVAAETFIAHFGEVKGERAKRLDKQLQATLERTPLVANKQFFAMQQIPLNGYYNTTAILDVIMENLRAVHPMNQFIKQAMV